MGRRRGGSGPGLPVAEPRGAGFEGAGQSRHRLPSDRAGPGSRGLSGPAEREPGARARRPLHPRLSSRLVLCPGSSSLHSAPPGVPGWAGAGSVEEITGRGAGAWRESGAPGRARRAAGPGLQEVASRKRLRPGPAQSQHGPAPKRRPSPSRTLPLVSLA